MKEIDSPGVHQWDATEDIKKQPTGPPGAGRQQEAERKPLRRRSPLRLALAFAAAVAGVFAAREITATPQEFGSDVNRGGPSRGAQLIRHPTIRNRLTLTFSGTQPDLSRNDIYRKEAILSSAAGEGISWQDYSLATAVPDLSDPTVDEQTYIEHPVGDGRIEGIIDGAIRGPSGWIYKWPTGPMVFGISLSRTPGILNIVSDYFPDTQSGRMDSGVYWTEINEHGDWDARIERCITEANSRGWTALAGGCRLPGADSGRDERMITETLTFRAVQRIVGGRGRSFWYQLDPSDLNIAYPLSCTGSDLPPTPLICVRSGEIRINTAPDGRRYVTTAGIGREPFRENPLPYVNLRAGTMSWAAADYEIPGTMPPKRGTVIINENDGLNVLAMRASGPDRLVEVPVELDPLIAPPSDRDNDGILDGADNCPDRANVDQVDLNRNGIGDACEVECRGRGGFVGVTAPGEVNPSGLRRCTDQVDPTRYPNTVTGEDGTVIRSNTDPVLERDGTLAMTNGQDSRVSHTDYSRAPGDAPPASDWNGRVRVPADSRLTFDIWSTAPVHAEPPGRIVLNYIDRGGTSRQREWTGVSPRAPVTETIEVRSGILGVLGCDFRIIATALPPTPRDEGRPERLDGGLPDEREAGAHDASEYVAMPEGGDTFTGDPSPDGGILPDGSDAIDGGEEDKFDGHEDLLPPIDLRHDEIIGDTRNELGLEPRPELARESGREFPREIRPENPTERGRETPAAEPQTEPQVEPPIEPQAEARPEQPSAELPVEPPASDGGFDNGHDSIVAADEGGADRTNSPNGGCGCEIPGQSPEHDDNPSKTAFLFAAMAAVAVAGRKRE